MNDSELRGFLHSIRFDRTENREIVIISGERCRRCRTGSKIAITIPSIVRRHLSTHGVFLVISTTIRMVVFQCDILFIRWSRMATRDNSVFSVDPCVYVCVWACISLPPLLLSHTINKTHHNENGICLAWPRSVSYRAYLLRAVLFVWRAPKQEKQTYAQRKIHIWTRATHTHTRGKHTKTMANGDIAKTTTNSRTNSVAHGQLKRPKTNDWVNAITDIIYIRVAKAISLTEMKETDWCVCVCVCSVCMSEREW